MKRKALLIGCPGVGKNSLPGVYQDVVNFRKHLTSNAGGAWYDSEITTLYNKSKDEIVDAIETFKNLPADIAFVLFSGHGNYSDVLDCRRLYIDDEKGILIYENDLKKLADRQILVIDSCAKVEREFFEKSTMDSSIAMEALNSSQLYYRQRYESEVLKCPNQQIKLYACGVDEYSSDTAKGGLYSKNLLNEAKSVGYGSTISAIEAHVAAAKIVVSQSDGDQNPDYVCSARSAAKLPLSVG